MPNDQNISRKKSEFFEDLRHPENFPFFFTYGGTAYHGFPAETQQKERTRLIKTSKKDSTELYFLLSDGLEVRLLFTFYPAFGVSEWTVYFKNTALHDSAVLENIGTSLSFLGELPVLKGILGDHVNQYRPYYHDLSENPIRFYSDSGRPTHVNFPYFNLEYGDGGAFLAIGWAGTWSADFSVKNAKTEYAASSTPELHTVLHPGEEIRTALFVFAPYKGRNEQTAMNFWRRWFIECNLPPFDAEGHMMPFSTCCLAQDTGLPNSDGSISERSTSWRPSLEKMLAENIRVDFRWLDAGWYTAPDGSSPESDWWGTVGTWELDPKKWPGKTFLESTDFARAHDMRTLMWFEPERVTDPENLVKNYGYHPDWAIRREGCGAISNNIGIPECLQWTTERICKVLRENKVEMYREDNNSDPGKLWRYLDDKEGEDRTGITECKFVAAHYKMWDDILACTRSFGGCGFVDSCASGGGRNDLESLRRGIPLLRSDSDRTSSALRLSMTTAFNRWIPFCGANTKEKRGQLDPTGRSDVYTWRASYLPVLNIDSQYVQDQTQDFNLLRFGIAEWKKVAPYFLNDFYVLTPWHIEEDKTGFTAYSFFDPEKERGVLLLFRMEDCPEKSLCIRLPFALKETYLLTDEDTKQAETVAGAALKNEGVVFTFNEPRQARLIWIEKQQLLTISEEQIGRTD